MYNNKLSNFDKYSLTTIAVIFFRNQKSLTYVTLKLVIPMLVWAGSLDEESERMNLNTNKS